MIEGGTGAPTRHPLGWRDADFHDHALLDAEMRRIFDICHGCRRCFNLCDSFPRLFDLIDDSPSGELDTVDSGGFKAVVDACTLCDMCFMSKCPYVPPHEFNVDFPHLMLRFRAAEVRRNGIGLAARQLTKTDRNGRAARFVAPIANWASATSNTVMRALLEKIAGVHRAAALPRFHRKTFSARARRHAPAVNRAAPAFGRKAVLYATCFVEYNDPGIGEAAQAVLAHNGVECEVVYPSCCGMPQLEHGDIEAVAARARTISATLGAWIDKGYDVIALVPSCALMLKSEWPLIAPDDAGVRRLAGATRDISEYVVDIARNEGLTEGLGRLEGGVALHIACHARAQNMGQKAREMLELIPGADIEVIERCSGHGGSWGVMKDNFEVALKLGKPVAQKARDSGKAFVASECPLAGAHIAQGIERLDGEAKAAVHPIELFARACGIAC
ncbi:MAG: glycerol-3-phosphate dehydrogenase [Proteobacteria bacterium]|nr:glycerol-3-phosphate dehydrogenase [Pseudomonadota bacterium]